LAHPLHHVLHPNKWLFVVLIIFHLLRPFQVLGFDLGFANVIGRYKSLLRSLMLRCLVPRCMRTRSLMPWCLSPWSFVRCLISWSLMLGQRSNAMISWSGYFFLDLRFLCFKEGALGLDMPTQTVVVAYRRSSDGMRLLSAWYIIINLVLPFIFSNGGRLWDCRFDKYSLGSRGSVIGRSYIPKTSLVD
jgi:hypothetical protein